MLLERSHCLRPAEAHAAERFDRFDIIFDDGRRVLDDLLLSKRWHWRCIMLLFLPTKRQTNLSQHTSVHTLILSWQRGMSRDVHSVCCVWSQQPSPWSNHPWKDGALATSDAGAERHDEAVGTRDD